MAWIDIVLAVSVGLATIGVCVFCADYFGSRTFYLENGEVKKMKKAITVTHILFPIFIGLIIGGIIADNPIWVLGLIYLIADVIAGIVLQHLLEKRYYKSSVDYAFEVAVKEAIDEEVNKIQKALKSETAVKSNVLDQTVSVEKNAEESKSVEIERSTLSKRTERILTYFQNVKGEDADVEIAPNGQEIITVQYQRLYCWTLCIVVDVPKKTVKMYAWFFKVANAHNEDIYEVLNEWNREALYATYTVEDTQNGAFVLVRNDIPIVQINSFEKIVFDIADMMVRTMDEQFSTMPKGLAIV